MDHVLYNAWVAQIHGINVGVVVRSTVKTETVTKLLWAASVGGSSCKT